VIAAIATTNVFSQNLPVDSSVRIGVLPNGMKYYPIIATTTNP
jgi:zinc protease